ncbi:MAG: response regulator receiver protein [Verrucomicrobia bacterium]|nr:MAG: response regulator receiver protein [Verrucomicrobiota bacterium]
MNANDRSAATILVVEDDPNQFRLYGKVLKGYRLTCVVNASAALKVLEERLPDLIILDHVLADGERGTDFLPRLKEQAAHVPVIVVSGTLDIHEQLKVLQGPRSAHYVLEKPVRAAELSGLVEQALTQCGLGETVRALQSLERAEKIESNEPERRFVERLARQHEILNQLRASLQPPNVSALARQFNVDRKTIRRDLSDLVQRGQMDARLCREAEETE